MRFWWNAGLFACGAILVYTWATVGRSTGTGMASHQSVGVLAEPIATASTAAGDVTGAQPTDDFNPPVNEHSDPPWVPPADRYECVQAWVNRTFAYDHNPDLLIPGCDTPAVYDFERWGQASRCGVADLPATLLMHTAWLGPVDGIYDELVALIDSFLATQHTADGRASFTVWFMESEPPGPSAAIRRRYQSHDNAAVLFKAVDYAQLAAGTCLDGKAEYLDVQVVGVDYKSKGTMGPKEKADMTRLLLLNAYGGVWVDTDSVLLRDFRPLVAFAGPNFAAQVTLSPYFNNNAMGLAKGGSVAKDLLQIVCDTPFTPRGKQTYCSVVGRPCYPKWYWNHGVIQVAVRRKLGLVVVPWTFTDPAYSCFPPLLLAAAGGKRAPNLVIEDALEMIRGAFVLHTRGYNAAKPLSNLSGFAKLYARAEMLAARRPAPAGGVGAHLYRALGPRSPADAQLFEQLLADRGPNVVEPTFVPRYGQSITYKIATARFPDQCLTADRARSIGDYPTVSLGKCTATRATDQETRHWRIHGATPAFNATGGDPGYLRPALVKDLGGGMWGRVLCVSGLPWHSKDEWSGEPCLIVCTPKSPSQRWVFDFPTGQIRNDGLAGMCLQAVERKPVAAAVMRACHRSNSVGKSQRWIFSPV